MEQLRNTRHKGSAAAGRKIADGTPIFFFDGDFRTWDGVVRRALLNEAFSKQMA